MWVPARRQSLRGRRETVLPIGQVRPQYWGWYSSSGTIMIGSCCRAPCTGGYPVAEEVVVKGIASHPDPSTEVSQTEVGGAPPRRIRVLVVDDHSILRRGIRTMLTGLDDIEWVGDAEDGAQAIGEVARLSPDVVLMDLSMPALDGSSATAIITAQHPGVKVLVLTGYTDATRIRAALDAGAVGVINKDGDSRTVLDAIRNACAIGPGPAP